MPSGIEGYQEEGRLDLPVRLELGDPEKQLLAAIFWKTSLDPDVLGTLLTSGKSTLPAARATAELVQRWVQNHVPTTQIEEISILASSVLGDSSEATKWLSESNLATDNRPPIDLIGEKDGYDRIKNLLLRIEYGALA